MFTPILYTQRAILVMSLALSPINIFFMIPFGTDPDLASKPALLSPH